MVHASLHFYPWFIYSTTHKHTIIRQTTNHIIRSQTNYNMLFKGKYVSYLINSCGSRCLSIIAKKISWFFDVTSNLASIKRYLCSSLCSVLLKIIGEAFGADTTYLVEKIVQIIHKCSCIFILHRYEIWVRQSHIPSSHRVFAST
jgi:hypothetical protein